MAYGTLDLGVDYNINGKLDANGQLPLVSDLNCINQDIIVKLFTYEGVYDDKSDGVGTIFADLIGKEWDNNTIIEAIGIIQDVFENEPRIYDFEIKYIEDEGFIVSYVTINDILGLFSPPDIENMINMDEIYDSEE